MELSSGGKSEEQQCADETLTFHRISRTMGESFKLHSQALVGYVDEMNMDPMTGMPQVSDQALMGMEAAY